MAGYGSRSQMVNSWERHRLGWINPMQYNYNPLLPVPLLDYLTTGQVLRILIPSSNPARYYYLENHQRISQFDNIDLTTDGKGIYVIYQSGSTDNTLRFWNAEGRSIWTKDHCATYPPNGPLVPVFIEGLQTPSGKFDTEGISYTACYTGGSTFSPIEAYVSPINGQDEFQPLFAGDNRDMMKPDYVDVFNPVSNPAVEGISFQVISQSNQLKIIQKVETGTIYNTPPSKPQNLLVEPSQNDHPYLTWDANQEPDMLRYDVWKKKVINGVLQWNYLASTTNNYYEDNAEEYCPAYPQNCINESNIYYRVKAVDTQYLTSVSSDSVMARVDGTPPQKAVVQNTNKPVEYSLMQNYPNPFNPTTTISFSLPKNGLVTLKIFDILGRDVAELVNESKEAGNYSVAFNASALPSGIYFYTLTTGNFTATKKLILLK